MIIPFGLLVLARLLGHCYRGWLAGRLLYALVLGAFMLGNAARLAAFARDGRGYYRETVRFFAQLDPGFSSHG